MLAGITVRNSSRPMLMVIAVPSAVPSFCLVLDKPSTWYQDVSLPVFSLFGAKVLSGNLCSQERKFPGTFVPRRESSHWELSFRV